MNSKQNKYPCNFDNKLIKGNRKISEIDLKMKLLPPHSSLVCLQFPINRFPCKQDNSWGNSKFFD